MPDVVNVVHQSAHAFEAETECKAGIDRRVDTACAKHIRMDHSRAAELYPAGTFAWAAAFSVDLACTVTSETGKVELSRGLSKREVRRTKTRNGVRAIHPFEPLGHRAFQVSHRDTFVDTEAFELMEHRRVRHIGRVAAKDLARCENSKRNAAPFHGANLNG